MNLQFNSVGELAEFLEFARLLGNAVPADTVEVRVPAAALTAHVHAAAAELAVTDPQSPLVPKILTDEQVTIEPPSPKVTVRKRRTKAEMEAARAAEQSDAPAVTEAGQTEMTPAGTPAAVAPENTGNPFAQAELPAEQLAAAPETKPADTGDLKDFLAARVAERPELSQVEHLNLARGFIAKAELSRTAIEDLLL